MNNVDQYVNVMRKNTSVTTPNTNSEIDQLKRELIEYYKSNLLKAYSTVNSMMNTSNLSETQRAHYEAASIATGRPLKPPTTEFNFTPGAELPSKKTDLNKLIQSGWKPLNEDKAQLLNG